MTDPDDAGWEWAQDDEARRFFQEADQALKDDAEAYNRWIDEVVRAGFEGMEKDRE